MPYILSFYDSPDLTMRDPSLQMAAVDRVRQLFLIVGESVYQFASLWPGFLTVLPYLYICLDRKLAWTTVDYQQSWPNNRFSQSFHLI